MALMFFFFFSLLRKATFPHVLESSEFPPEPNPILELQVVQSFSLLPMIPILALENGLSVHAALKPSLLQPVRRDASGPISVFHVLRPSEVVRYCSSAISEYRELACLLITVNFICWSIFMPMQILEKDVSQYVGNFVSCESNPVSPPGRLYSVVLLQYPEL